MKARSALQIAPAIKAFEVAQKYAVDVIKGRIVTGTLVKLAARRFIRDIKYGAERGLKLDKDAAQTVVNFFGYLKHSKGEWGGLPFVLDPWQVFILVNLFGWKWKGSPDHDDDTRRFRQAHIEIARKNGKTTFLAGIGLYLLKYDDEPGAEVYSAATKKDQAKILFDEACRMRQSSPALKAGIQAFRNNLCVLESHSKFEPLSSEDDTLDGLNSHGILIDELHAHPNRKLFDVLHESTASRRNPLTVSITTAGFDQHGICYLQRNIAVRILTDSIPAAKGDDTFAFIASIDEDDDPLDEKCWPKSNPSLGVSVKIDKLRAAAAAAEADPTALNSFLRKHMNVWTSQDIRWMGAGKWALCCAAGNLADPVKSRIEALEKLKGRSAIGALDLSSKVDLASFVLLFPPVKRQTEMRAKPQTRDDIMRRKPVVMEEIVTQEEDIKWRVVPWFWVPDANIQDRVDRDRVEYDVWKREGLLETCPGNSNDHEIIRAKILELRNTYRFDYVGYDSWSAQWIGKKLADDDGLKMIEVRQGFKSMTEPMKELMAKTLSKSIEHYGNPILAWNIDNVQALTDPAGNIKPDKEKSKEKIDGAVAVIMSLALVCADPTLVDNESPYSKRGIVFI